MNLTEETRKDIINFYINIISAISNKEYQNRIWIKGLGPQVDSFDDTVCEYFPTNEAILKEYKEFGITNEQYELLNKLQKEFEVFLNEWNGSMPKYFIDTPEWNKICQMAQEIVKAFNYTNEILSITDPTEFELALKKKYGNRNLKNES